MFEQAKQQIFQIVQQLMHKENFQGKLEFVWDNDIDFEASMLLALNVNDNMTLSQIRNFISQGRYLNLEIFYDGRDPSLNELELLIRPVEHLYQTLESLKSS